MKTILINKKQNINIDIGDILSFVSNKKEVKVNLKNWTTIISDRKMMDLISEFNIKRKGGDIDNMSKQPVKKGTKKGTKKGK